MTKQWQAIMSKQRQAIMSKQCQAIMTSQCQAIMTRKSQAMIMTRQCNQKGHEISVLLPHLLLSVLWSEWGPVIPPFSSVCFISSFLYFPLFPFSSDFNTLIYLTHIPHPHPPPQKKKNRKKTPTTNEQKKKRPDICSTHDLLCGKTKDAKQRPFDGVTAAVTSPQPRGPKSLHPCDDPERLSAHSLLAWRRLPRTPPPPPPPYHHHPPLPPAHTTDPAQPLKGIVQSAIESPDCWEFGAFVSMSIAANQLHVYICQRRLWSQVGRCTYIIKGGGGGGGEREREREQFWTRTQKLFSKECGVNLGL